MFMVISGYQECLIKLRYNTEFKNSRAQLHANLLILVFQEEDAYIAYSPALDLSGYGYSDQEAKDSFEIALKNFLDITSKKKILYSELKRMGWKVHGSEFGPEFSVGPLHPEARKMSIAKNSFIFCLLFNSSTED
jgi:hypothetical protein